MNTQNSLRYKARGFTLVEILIVFAIVSILAALTFAVFSRVGEGGRRASCASNLKQLGMAFTMYAQDNIRLPAGRGAPPDTGAGWAGSIYPYVRTTQLYICPSDAGIDNVRGSVSYAYNNAFVQEYMPKYLKMSQFRNPSRTVLLCEISTQREFDISNANEDRSPSACGLPFCVLNDVRYATGYLGGRIFPPDAPEYLDKEGRHAGVANFLFVDGHVKSLRGNQISPGAPAPNSTALQDVNAMSAPAAGTGNANFAGTFSPI